MLVLSDGYFDSWKHLGYCTFLRSGREAIAFAAQNSNSKNLIALLPAYCCWSMSAPFERLGWKVIFYRLMPNLSADLDYLEKLLRKHHPGVLLTMNYFGIAPTDSTVTFVKNICPSCTVIEDFSHCTFSLPTIYNPMVDFYVSSIRKSIGVCDGAVVVSAQKADLRFVLEADVDFAILRQQAQCDKEKYRYTQNTNHKQVFRQHLSDAEDRLNQFHTIHAISPTAMQMLATVNGNHIAFARRINLEHLLACLVDLQHVVLFPNMSQALSGAPFSLPVLTQRRDELQYQLTLHGLYAPVLWPISKEAQNVCPISARMSKEMLSLPIDQRFDYNDIEEIGNIIIQTVTDLYA